MFDENRTGGGDEGQGGGDAATHVSRDWRDIDRRMRRLAGRRATLDLEEAQLLMLAKRAEIHRRLGYGSFTEYLERVLGYAPNTGRDRVRVAEELETLPAIADAWAHGKLTYSVVREITRVATPETENQLLAHVEGRTVREVIDSMRGLAKGADPDKPRDPDLEPRRVPLELPPETYSLFLQARRELERQVGHAMSDADFVAVACRALLSGAADDRPNTPPHQIALTVCEQCNRGWHDVPGASIEVSPAAIALARCDAVELGRVDAATGAAPPASRPIPAPTRRAVLARDKHRCQVPGCTNGIVDVHHIDPFGEGGDHSMQNLVTLCTLHHKHHHDGKIRVSGRPGALVVTHSDGRPYGTPPAASPADELANARLALTTMGFRPAEAKAAVERAATHVSRDASLEALIRAALRECPSAAQRPHD